MAKRAGQRRGWRTVEVRTITGEVVVKRYKTFLATWRPAGGEVRVEIVKEGDGSWRALLCTDSEAAVQAIVDAAQDRWVIEKDQPHYTSRHRWCGARTPDYHQRRGAA